MPARRKSPKRRSPKRRSRSPKRKSRSPKRKSRSPKRKSRSPKRRTSRRSSRKVRKLPKIKPNESNPCSSLRKASCPGNPNCGWRKRLGCYRKKNVVKNGLVFEGPMFESM